MPETVPAEPTMSELRAMLATPAPDAPGVAKRIGKALKAQREAEARTAELEAQLAEQTASRPAAAATAPPVVKVEAPGKPDSKKFDTYEEYVEALTDWKVASAKAADAQADATRRATEAQVAKGLAWNERAKAAEAIHPDFADVMTEAGTLPISEAMHVTIFESERGPELAYHLATNPDEAARIAKLTPLAAAAALGKIEAGLPAVAASETVPATPAAAKPLPKPAARVGGGQAPQTVDLNDPKLSMKAFTAEARKQLQAA
jgi:hypothetical protein